MHVAVIFSGLPPEGGGAHTFQQSLLEALDGLAPASGHTFTYYTTGSSQAGDRPVVAIPWTWRGVLADRALRAMRDVQDRLQLPRSRARTWLERSLDERGVELVWFPSHFAHPLDVPFFFTLWDLAHLETPWFPEVAAGGEWERRQHYFSRFLPRATRVIVPNEALERTLERNYGLGGERVVKLPFPTPPFALAPPPDDAAARVRRLGVEPPFLFYPAQFWPHKNHFNALRALRVLDADESAAYTLVCSGSDKGGLDHVRALARELGVADRLSVLGFVDQRDLAALYAEAHALLYLSFFGPENLPPLEALGLGCPVVCADVPGMALQLDDAALFADPTDPDAIAAQVRRLADPELRAELVERGRRLAEERSTLAYVQRVLDEISSFEAVRRCWR